MTKEQRKEARTRIKLKLGEYILLERERLQLIEEIQVLEAKRTGPGSIRMDGMPRGSSNGDAMASGLIQKEELQARYARKVQEMEAVQSAIEDLIEGLNPTERKLFRHRYIEGMTWENVCVAMSYSWRQTHNIHAKALDKLIDRSEV